MESFHDLLVTVVRLTCTIVVIILFFLFIVRPLLDYFITSHEIEHRKNLGEELSEDEGGAGDVEVGRGSGSGEMGPRDDFPVQRPARGLSEQEKLSRLAASDPEKAGELVKQWVNSDSSR